MGIVDVIIVLIIIFGVYIGWQHGVIKQISDLVILMLTSFVSGKISDKLFSLLYKYLPFLNFKGKAEGLKSINIIFWKIMLYLACILLIIYIISMIFKKTKLEEKISNSMVEAGGLSKIFGAVLSVPLMILLIFNLSLILLSPNFNLKAVASSKLSSLILTKTPILFRQNINLYSNQKYIIKRINEEDNTYENYETVNEDIINNILQTKLVSNEIIENLKNDNKLVGTRKQKTQDNYDNTEHDDNNVPNDDKNSNRNNNDDDNNDLPYDDTDDNYDDSSDDTSDSSDGYDEDDSNIEDNIDVDDEPIEEDVDDFDDMDDFDADF